MRTTRPPLPLLAMLLTTLLWPALARGRPLKPVPPEQIVKSATVVAIARVKNITTTRPPCLVVSDAHLEIRSYLKGGPLKDRAVIDRQVEHSFDPSGGWPDETCPVRSYPRGPRAKMAVGMAVVVTLFPWATPPSTPFEQVTGTFDLGELPKIKRWLAERAAPP